MSNTLWRWNLGNPGRIVLFAVLIWLAALVPALAEPDAFSAPAASMVGFDLSKGSIRIKADTLVASQAENMARFEGHVVATQEKTIIKSDTLKIWYTPAPGADKEQGALPSTQALEKIQASGNVRITNDSFTSQSDQAIYTQKDGNLVLTGDQAEVISGRNKVQGATITRSREGLLTFEGGVVAEFFPEESGAGESKPAQEGK
ncbi:MAG: hypothetical protein JEZ02_15765 [Desulfatibacillum sp.]|nr:hypothetical protein [Desulfatibacillum sp.]